VAVSRYGETLHVQNLVLAEGDSISVRGRFPLVASGLRIVSRENAALTAVQNTQAQYNEMVVAASMEGSADDATLARLVSQTSAVYWSLRDTYPGTLGARFAEAESIAMLDGWNDSLAVERALSLDPDHPNRVDLARAARRSAGRIGGVDSAMVVIDYFADGADPAQVAALDAERVLVYTGAGDRTEALREARALQENHPESQWARWAERAIYELETLQPGMEAPDIELIDRDGQPLRVSDYRDQYVMLEFFAPTNTVFNQELVIRETLLQAADAAIFAAVSISLDPDELLNADVIDGRDLSGRFVIDSDGFEGVAARAYNVNSLPTRVLINPEGEIIRKYTGLSIEQLQADLFADLEARSEQN
jgi:peroxiredoxin